MSFVTDRCRRGASGVIALIAVVWSASAAAIPEVQRWHTDNGAEVLFVQAPEIPMVDIRVVFAAGAARDGELPGIGALTNALLAEGAGELNADQIAEAFDGVGANFSNTSLRDMSIFSLRSLIEPERLEPALATFTTVLAEPTFPAKAFQRERARIMVALRHEKQSPSDIAERTFYEALYGEHPYANPVLGTEASLQAMDVADIRTHYRRYYVGRNAVVAIVGDVDRQGAEKLARRVVGALPAGEPTPSLPKPVPLQKAQRVDKAHPSTQTHIWSGQLGIQRDDEDYIPLYVGNHILGGAGLVSQISQQIREERGLAYSAWSALSPMEARGPFIMGLQTANRNRDEALEVLHATFQRFVEQGPDAEELKRAVDNITGGYPLQIDANSDIIGYLGMIGFYDLPLDYMETFPDRVKAVTAEDIRRAYQRVMHPDRLLTVTVGQS